MLDLTNPFTALLVVLAILEVKHFLCDFPLQTLYQLQNKGRYGHPGGLAHAFIHIIGTAVCFVVVTPALWLGAAILAGEFLFHYHADWAKEQWIRRHGYTATDNQYWWALGFDQLLHHLTYILIAGLLVGATLGTG